MIKSMGKIPVQFTVMPYRYAVNNEWQTLEISGQWTSNIFNECPNTVLPVLKIWSDAGFVDFNYPPAGTIRINNVDEYVIVDVPKRRVYDKNGNIILNHTTGNILKLELQPENNLMYWHDGTKKVEYLLNKRWL